MRIAAPWSSILKSRYVEREMTRPNVNVGGTSPVKPPIMDIADYLKQVSQPAGRELWRLRKTLLKQDNDADQVIE